MAILMTGEQINTVNELLKNHSESLTAFWDEAYKLGSRNASAASFIGGMTVGFGIAVAIYIYKQYKQK